MPRSTRLALVFLPLLAGCASTFLADRWLDARQVLGFDAGLATGVHGHVMATKLAQAGIGSLEGTRYGLIGGDLTSHELVRAEVGVSLLYLHEMENDPRSGGVVGHTFARPYDPGWVAPYAFEVEERNDRDFFDVGAEANLFVFGFSFTLHLAELADLVTGLLGFDLLDDDPHRRPIEEHLRRLRSSDPDCRARAVRSLRILTGERYNYLDYNIPDEFPDFQKRAVERWERNFGKASE